MKEIYLVFSQTGSIVSKLIRHYTHEPYSHVSISLDKNLKTLYSFGRTQLYNVFSGGFIKESPDYGMFKRFSESQIAVLRLTLRDDKFEALSALLERMYRERKKYRYNRRGLFLAAKGKNVKRENRYYCSEFILELLIRYGLVHERDFGVAVRPTELMKLPDAKLVFKGRISCFAQPQGV